MAGGNNITWMFQGPPPPPLYLTGISALLQEPAGAAEYYLKIKRRELERRIIC